MPVIRCHRFIEGIRTWPCRSLSEQFGRISPTTAYAVKEEFGSELKMVLDGGACDVGIESTIVDLSIHFLNHEFCARA